MVEYKRDQGCRRRNHSKRENGAWLIDKNPILVGKGLYL